MGFINRFLLFFYTLFIALLCVGVSLILLQVVPGFDIINECQYLISKKIELGAGALLLFLISVHLWICSFSSHNKGTQVSKNAEIITVRGSDGETLVTLAAIKEMVLHLATTAQGVRDAVVKVGLKDEGENNSRLVLDIDLSISKVNNVALVSDNLRKIVQAHLAHVLDLKEFELNIEVTNILSGVEVRKRPLA